jgi:hypothetical protein
VVVIGAGRAVATGPLEIHGGAGGTSARLDELDRAADRLGRLGDELVACGGQATAVACRVQVSGGQVLDPVGFAAVEAALLGVVTGSGSATALGSGLRGIAEHLHAAAASYRAADAAVAGSLRAGDFLAGRAAGLGVLLGLPFAGSLLVPLLPPMVGLQMLNSPGSGNESAGSGTLVRLLTEHDELTEHLIGAVPGLVGTLGLTPGPVTVRGLALRLLAAAGLAGLVAQGRRWLDDPPGVRVSRPGPGTRTRPVAGVAGLIAAIPASSGSDPVVRIDRVDGPSGRHWVVLIPGTDTLSLRPRVSPFDVAGAVSAAGGRRTAGVAAVELAMDRANIPPGEPVLLAGHSQGGMIATAIAADPVARQRFSVTHVLTAGSPIAQSPMPGGVQVLSVEHTNDLVPLLDGAPNPDRAQWTTVRATAPLDPDLSPLAAHDRVRYAATGQQVDASADASIQSWRSGSRGFMAAPGTTSTSWTLHISRA